MEKLSVEETAIVAAGKINYLMYEVDFSDELLLYVAKAYYKKYGYIPESWKEYIESKLSK